MIKWGEDKMEFKDMTVGEFLLSILGLGGVFLGGFFIGSQSNIGISPVWGLLPYVIGSMIIFYLIKKVRK